ncbi:MAG TPA: WD40 repeat domain-containing protein [Candidatus Acidoferrales bacterium]|nr:WD40 repeat domain-containing protein [Candidatus Acidoferrales bacterium]
MPTRSKRPSEEITRAQTKAITVLSSSLVLRGIREFPQASRWNVRQAFVSAGSDVSISPLGRVAAYSTATRESSQRIEIADLETSVQPVQIVIPDEPFIAHPDFPAAFAWAPDERNLVAASGTWQSELHLFDPRAGAFLGRFGAFRVYPTHLCWSDGGQYFAAASDGSEHAKLTLWMPGIAPEKFDPLCEMDRNVFAESPAPDTDDGDQGNFYGFGATAFRPDERMLATVLEFDGDWSDDSILFVRVPTLEIVKKFETTGHVTQLSWSGDGRRLVFCSSGQAYSLDSDSEAITSLPFAAEMCQCHPTLPLCGFYNSWLKNSAAGRIFVADLQRSVVIDECRAEGIGDIRWSSDGRTFYAVARDGTAYLFDCQLP